MNISEIIFANFWTWAGTVILLVMLLDGTVSVIKALRKPERTVRRTTFEDGTVIVQINNATVGDIRRAVKEIGASEHIRISQEDEA